MKIKNTETGMIEDVRYDVNGCDALPDVLGNIDMDGITHVRDEGYDECDGETLDWIKDYVAKLETLDTLMAALSDDDAQSVIDCTDAVEDAMDAVDNRIKYARELLGA